MDKYVVMLRLKTEVAVKKQNMRAAEDLIEEIFTNARVRGHLLGFEIAALERLVASGATKWLEERIVRHARNLKDEEDRLRVLQIMVDWNEGHCTEVAQWAAEVDIDAILGEDGSILQLVRLLDDYGPEDTMQRDRYLLLEKALERAESDEEFDEIVGRLLWQFSVDEFYDVFKFVVNNGGRSNDLAVVLLGIARPMFETRRYYTLGDAIKTFLEAEERDRFYTWSTYVGTAVREMGFHLLLMPKAERVQEVYCEHVATSRARSLKPTYMESAGVAYSVAVKHGIPVSRSLQTAVRVEPVAAAAALDCALRLKERGVDTSAAERILEEVDLKRHAEFFTHYSKLRREMVDFLERNL